MKIRPVEGELFHADGRRDKTVAFRNFANPPKNVGIGRGCFPCRLNANKKTNIYKILN